MAAALTSAQLKLSLDIKILWHEYIFVSFARNGDFTHKQHSVTSSIQHDLANAGWAPNAQLQRGRSAAESHVLEGNPTVGFQDCNSSYKFLQLTALPGWWSSMARNKKIPTTFIKEGSLLCKIHHNQWNSSQGAANPLRAGGFRASVFQMQSAVSHFNGPYVLSLV